MKKYLSIALILIMVCALTITAYAAPESGKPDPKPGNPMWDDVYKGQGALVDPSVSARTDASGDKITSNAHSGDVPGLYFYWDDNNKSVLDGTLLVADSFFDLVKGEAGSRAFTITAKNSNAYWDYEIVEGAGNVVVKGSGVSAYKIPRFFMYTQSDKKTGALVIDKKTGLPVLVKDELKNINMVFISGDWIDATITIEKIWLDEEGNEFTGDNSLVKFNAPYVLGDNTIGGITSLGGKKVTVTEAAIPGFTTKQNPISVTVKPGDTKSITFVNQKQWANIKINKVWLADCDCIDECVYQAVYDGYHIVAAPDDIKAEFTINGQAAVLGNNQVKAGAYTVSELDGLLAGSGWELYSENDVAITVAAGKCETVTFYNLFVPGTAAVTIKKEWIDWDEENDSHGLKVVFTDGENDCYSGDTIYYTPLPAGGMDVSISEIVDEAGFIKEDAEYTYSWALLFIDVFLDGELIDTIEGDDAAKLTLFDKDDYLLVFCNVIDRKKKTVDPKDITDKIPSKTHIDKWWDAYGILAYGGSSNKDKDVYFVAFDDDFWQKNASVTIGFGTKDKLDILATIYLDEEGNLACDHDKIIFYDQQIGGSVYFDNHYTTPKEKNHKFDISICAYFGNPLESGKMQLWLLNITAIE